MTWFVPVNRPLQPGRNGRLTAALLFAIMISACSGSANEHCAHRWTATHSLVAGTSGYETPEAAAEPYISGLRALFADLDVRAAGPRVVLVSVDDVLLMRLEAEHSTNGDWGIATAYTCMSEEDPDLPVWENLS